jgi:hypothetical protein
MYVLNLGRNQMRVNVYAEEMTNRVELVRKEVGGEVFTGVRFYLELPVTVGEIGGVIRGPFLHHRGDDDSAAVTFWGKQELRKALEKALDLLNSSTSAIKV